MKLGLCLSGGGARGAYQIGACTALKEAGILEHVEVISGTSIGAANAALIATNPIEKAKEIWFNIPDLSESKTESILKRIIKERSKLAKNGIYELNELKNTLKDNVDFNILKQKRVFVTLSAAGEASQGVSAIIKASFRHYIKHDTHVVYIPLWKQKKDIVYDQIIASCSIPVIFPPTYIDGKQYFDGGIYDNVPVRPLVEAGCDTIIVLHLDKLPYFYKMRYKDVVFHSIMSRHLLGRHLKFTSELSEIRFNYGYEDMKKYLEDNKII